MKKEEILEKLQKLKSSVIEIKEISKGLKSLDSTRNFQGLEVINQRLDEIIEKIDRSIDNINKEKVHIALFGAFSDGKSSIASAILRNFNIKIAPEPTTDKVTFYEYGNYFIVDTPGAFSYSHLQDEKTRKYISEANVILFVVDAVNPIKDSHKDLVKEVLVDIGKLENTIFVLNKMDNVVIDLEDEEEYNEKAEKKKEALLEALDYFNLSPKDKEKIRIVAVSANPNSLGFEHWSKAWDEYLKLSRIENLIREIQDVYQKHRERIIYNIGVSVILDITNELEKLTNPDELKDEINKLDEFEKSIRDSYFIMKNHFKRAFGLYKNTIERIRQDYFLKLDMCENHKELSDFVKNYIGENDKIEKIENRIKSEVEDILQIVDTSVKEFYKSLEILREFESSEENKEKSSTTYRNLPIDLLQNLLTNKEIQYNVIMAGGMILIRLGSFIISLGRPQIMRELLHFRSACGLGDFISKGTHVMWLSRWGNIIQGLGIALSIIGAIATITSVVNIIKEKKELDNKKAKLREFLERLFSQISSLGSLLELAGIKETSLDKDFENFIRAIDSQKNTYQKYYESLNQVYKSLKQLKESVLGSIREN